MTRVLIFSFLSMIWLSSIAMADIRWLPSESTYGDDNIPFTQVDEGFGRTEGGNETAWGTIIQRTRGIAYFRFLTVENRTETGFSTDDYDLSETPLVAGTVVSLVFELSGRRTQDPYLALIAGDPLQESGYERISDTKFKITSVIATSVEETGGFGVQESFGILMQEKFKERKNNTPRALFLPPSSPILIVMNMKASAITGLLPDGGGFTDPRTGTFGVSFGNVFSMGEQMTITSYLPLNFGRYIGFTEETASQELKFYTVGSELEEESIVTVGSRDGFTYQDDENPQDIVVKAVTPWTIGPDTNTFFVGIVDSERPVISGLKRRRKGPTRSFKIRFRYSDNNVIIKRKRKPAGCSYAIKNVLEPTAARTRVRNGRGRVTVPAGRSGEVAVINCGATDTFGNFSRRKQSLIRRR